MTPQERLLRDMARCPDLFGASQCELMQQRAQQMQAARLAHLY